MNCRSFDLNAEERKINYLGTIISVYSDGSVWNHRGGNSKRRFGDITPKGYMKIIVRENGTMHTVYVHKLVAIAFIENPQNKPQVNHKNGIKTDNRPQNLEWCTNLENANHRAKVLHKFSSMTRVICIETGEVFETVSEAARVKNARRCNIQRCFKFPQYTCSGYHWGKL